jgi:hypothetical protein
MSEYAGFQGLASCNRTGSEGICVSESIDIRPQRMTGCNFNGIISQVTARFLLTTKIHANMVLTLFSGLPWRFLERVYNHPSSLLFVSNP